MPGTGLDAAGVRRALADLTEVTHLFYAAYQDRPSFAEMVEPNQRMLVNVLRAVEPVARHGLAPTAYRDVSSWAFGDAVFSWDYDLIADGSKARRHGFHEYVDTAEMFTRIFDDMRSRKIIAPR